MKANIDVKSREEADMIRDGLADPEMRATVMMIGALTRLDHEARVRIMRTVSDHFARTTTE